MLLLVAASDRARISEVMTDHVSLQRMGWGAKRLGTLAQRPTRAAPRGARGRGEREVQKPETPCRLIL